MDSKIVDEIMEELSSTMERIETQSTAILEFIKEKGIAKDEELAPYLERAATASSVRWRATRVRLEHLFAGLEKSEQKAEEKKKSEEPIKAKKRDEPKESSSDRERQQKDGPSKMPQRTELAKADEGSERRSEQTHDVSAQPAPSTDEHDELTSNELDKRKNAA